MRHPIQWLTAGPLWEEARLDPTQERFLAPVLLRFASDAFMEELAGVLARDPAVLKGLVAEPETWRGPAVSSPPGELSPPAGLLKLYQPTHGRFYLVAASLVCRLPGLPDRRLEAATRDRVFFVLRKLGAEGQERAWSTANGWQPPTPANDSPGDGSPKTSQQVTPGWAAVADPERDLAPGEEMLPLFPVPYIQRSPARAAAPAGNGSPIRRRLLCGYIPVASRETSAAAPEASPPGESTIQAPEVEGDPRPALLAERVIEPWKELRDFYYSRLSSTERSLPENLNLIRRTSLFILLDLADFLEAEVRDVWDALPPGAQPPPSGSPQRTLFDTLMAVQYAAKTLGQALRAVAEMREQIEGMPAELPPEIPGEKRPYREKMPYEYDLTSPNFNSLSPSRLQQEIEAAWRLPCVPLAGPVAAPPVVPKVDPGAEDWYVLRCVYERPGCFPWRKPIISKPSVPFQLAQFFDPDAPARPLRLTMPVDTSTAGLRKFPRNVAFLLSDQLRKQMSRVTGLEDLMKKKLGPEAGVELGHICSLSIPIITICALILLMIIVQLLNIIFWWLPFFKICWPLNLKAKG